MALDDFSDAINSATASVGDALNSAGNVISSGISSATSFLSSGPASALSSLGNAISGALSSLGTAFSPLAGARLPLPNQLFSYATYDYVLGIAALSDDEVNTASYMNGAPLTLICKSANAEPMNRVRTEFGQFDYFIDKLQIVTTMGLEKGQTTNVFSLEFEITEPYSMGTFMMSLQEAAWQKNCDNYVQAPYLLTIDFRGNTETGMLTTIPNSSRKIPFKFKDITMTVDERGAVYKCVAFPWGADANSGHVSEIKTDASVKGTTVQEILQTGEKSLQVVMNQRLQQLKHDKVVNTPDTILILFPTDISSGPSSTGQGNQSDNQEKDAGATISVFSSTESAVVQQLNLTKSTVPGNNTYVQSPDNVNEIGKAVMGFGDTRKGDTPMGKDNKIIEEGNVIRSKNGFDPKTGDMRFSQDTDITKAIDAVLLNSEYSAKNMQANAIDSKGMRKWWRVDTQVYNITDKATQAQTGSTPRIIVYRIIPYGVHTSKLSIPGLKPPGIDHLARECVKVYDYIYTGKNVDILNFHIEVKTAFAGLMGATTIKRTEDNKRKDQASEANTPSNNERDLNPIPDGSLLGKIAGAIPVSLRHSGTSRPSDNIGGGGLETESSRAAKLFHDAATSAASMIALDMKIIGDPYWIVQSGTGNYTSMPTQYQNLNHDGSVSYQNSEVHVMVNFRTPVDINQTTGFYDFGQSTRSAPTLMWSGIYQVINVTSYFDHGQFTQTLTGPRVNGQELGGSGSNQNTINTSVPDKDKTNDDSADTNQGGQ